MYAVPAGQPPNQTVSYSVLSISSGQLSALPLPDGVSAVGFTRPHGQNILAVRQAHNKYQLQRYDLRGAYQATLGTIAHRGDQPAWGLASCGSGCNALSSPDGDTAVWGVAGDEMQLVGNRGGLISKLHVPGSGKPPSCVPLSWWNSTEVLADCGVAAASASGNDASQLWLVPTDGAQPTALAPVSGSASGSDDINGAWQAGSAVYVTSTSAAQCPNAATGLGGLDVLSVSQGQSTSPVTIPQTTGYHAAIVAGVGSQLLLLAQTHCPGTSSLLWYYPAKHTTQTLLAGSAGQVGVIAAVPYGNGPTAFTEGSF